MPIYEYRCDQCGHQFDFLAKRLSAEPETCPKCGAKVLKKLLSSFNAGSEQQSQGDAVPSCPSGTCCPTGNCAI